jgi:3-oxoacyl-[acyl-carrier-protein] synthase III
MNEPELAVFPIAGVHVTGIAACVPDNVIDNTVAARLLLGDQADGFVSTTGIQHRHVVTPEKTTALDLCCRAAETLLARDSTVLAAVRAVVFVTQSPDNLVPPNAPLVVQRMGIRPDVLSFDISQSCAGYVYGLSVAGLLARAMRGTVLLLNGDTMCDHANPRDPDSLLFGDAGAATLVAPAPDDSAVWWFGFRSESYGRESLYVPAGGARCQPTPDAWAFTRAASGVERRPVDVYMDGQAVFEYVVKAVPRYVKAFCAASGIQPGEVDLISFHQANRYLTQQAIRKSGLDIGRAVFSVQEYGNTGQTSVVLNLVSQAATRLRSGRSMTLLAGYGSGLATSLAYINIGPCACPDVVVYENA